MAFEIVKCKDKTYEWSCYQSAYGYISGTAKTLVEAKVRLALAEADLLERPYPRAFVIAALANPKKFARGLPKVRVKRK